MSHFDLVLFVPSLSHAVVTWFLFLCSREEDRQCLYTDGGATSVNVQEGSRIRGVGEVSDDCTDHVSRVAFG